MKSKLVSWPSGDATALSGNISRVYHSSMLMHPMPTPKPIHFVPSVVASICLSRASAWTIDPSHVSFHVLQREPRRSGRTYGSFKVNPSLLVHAELLDEQVGLLLRQKQLRWAGVGF